VTEVKFCGITREVDVQEAVRLGAAYVGAIMTDSPRRVTPAQARANFAAVIGTSVKRVGVFGDEPIEAIIDAAGEAGVDVIQLHGRSGSDPDLLRSVLGGVEVWRVLRVGAGGLTAEQRHGPRSDGVLLETLSKGMLGGTGARFGWDLVADDVRAIRSSSKIILAGGLNPENVGEGIALLEPDVVDVSSGVESEPGIKDHSRMAAFMHAVRQPSAPRAS
jgi:phosphoribosylanthranilate isomerase